MQHMLVEGWLSRVGEAYWPTKFFFVELTTDDGAKRLVVPSGLGKHFMADMRRRSRPWYQLVLTDQPSIVNEVCSIGALLVVNAEPNYEKVRVLMEGGEDETFDVPADIAERLLEPKAFAAARVALVDADEKVEVKTGAWYSGVIERLRAAGFKGHVKFETKDGKTCVIVET